VEVAEVPRVTVLLAALAEQVAEEMENLLMEVMQLLERLIQAVAVAVRLN
jgi:hypothetical protein